MKIRPDLRLSARYTSSIYSNAPRFTTELTANCKLTPRVASDYNHGLIPVFIVKSNASQPTT